MEASNLRDSFAKLQGRGPEEESQGRCPWDCQLPMGLGLWTRKRHANASNPSCWKGLLKVQFHRVGEAVFLTASVLSAVFLPDAHNHFRGCLKGDYKCTLYSICITFSSPSLKEGGL